MPAAEEAVKAHPRDGHAWRTLSEVQFAAGDSTGGVKALREACQLAPQRTDWRELLKNREKPESPGTH